MERILMIVLILSVSIAGTFSFPNQSPVQLLNQNRNIPKCMQAPASGLCLAYFPSFYYDPSTETCKTFIYGGCQGNENRFLTEAQCLAECGGYKPEKGEGIKLVVEPDDVSNESNESPVASDETQDDLCSLPMSSGSCRGYFPRFYFDGETCKTFVYGGCQGNDNNFLSEEDCQQKCGSVSTEEDEKSETTELPLENNQ